MNDDHMIVLAIEASPSPGSIALARDNELLAEKHWQETRSLADGLLPLIPDLLRTAGISSSDIDLFTVGTGPGSFSSLRIAAAAIHGYALPDNKPIRGISSGLALAAETHTELSADSVMVVGDARRERVWLGRFYFTGGTARLENDWQLCTREELRDHVRPDTTIVTSDTALLQNFLLGLDQGQVVTTPRYPQARQLAILAQQQIRDGIAAVGADPIYLHPPVFVPPRPAADADLASSQ